MKESEQMYVDACLRVGSVVWKFDCKVTEWHAFTVYATNFLIPINNFFSSWVALPALIVMVMRMPEMNLCIELYKEL